MQLPLSVKNAIADFGNVAAVDALDCISESLAVARALLEVYESSPASFEWRRDAERFTRTVDNWRFEPPTGVQTHAMLACVTELVAAIRRARVARSSTYAMTAVASGKGRH